MLKSSISPNNNNLSNSNYIHLYDLDRLKLNKLTSPKKGGSKNEKSESKNEDENSQNKDENSIKEGEISKIEDENSKKNSIDNNIDSNKNISEIIESPDSIFPTPENNENHTNKSPIDLNQLEILKKYSKFAGKEIGISTILGYCMGQQLRKFSNKAVKQLMQQVGGAVLFLQALHAGGQIKLNQAKIENDATQVLDADNDGKLTINDGLVMWKRQSQKFAGKVPSSGAFMAAFQLGLRKDIF